jgi:hypothetical protein
MISTIDKAKLEEFYKTLYLLKQSFEDINIIQSLCNKLYKNLDNTILLYEKSLENNINEIKANLVEYNKQHDELSNTILTFEDKSHSILNSAFELSLANSSKKKHKEKNHNAKLTVKNKSRIDIELEPYNHNTLIISEKEQKAFLPFFYSDIKDIYQKSSINYRTMQDVIDDLYIIPLDKFKNSSVARFRESFHLIRDKEKGSIIKAFDLGLELMFKYELNPVIIAACRKLDDFTCFEIKFEIMPKLSEKKLKG